MTRFARGGFIPGGRPIVTDERIESLRDLAHAVSSSAISAAEIASASIVTAPSIGPEPHLIGSHEAKVLLALESITDEVDGFDFPPVPKIPPFAAIRAAVATTRKELI